MAAGLRLGYPQRMHTAIDGSAVPSSLSLLSSSPLPAVTPAPSATGTETVLVVDDEPMVRELVHVMLEQRGYRVLVAGNGPEALRIGEGHHGPIDLLVSDVVMPEMRGPEVAARLAAARPGLKLLYMSGYTADAIDFGKGAIPFLDKPFTSDLLATKVREALDTV
jgi:two-component system cell cycle sensor histidine kinase/response regulator CckA